MQLTLCIRTKKKLTSCKTLHKLLCRADKTAEWPTFELAYTSLFGLSETNSLPVAPLHAAAWEVPGDTPYWMHADPVGITTDQHEAFLARKVLLDDDETTELLLDINQLLLAENSVLFAPQSERWLLNLPHEPLISTSSLVSTLGSSISDKLPTGADQAIWCRLFTELQMLLYTHPVNTRRRQRQLPTIDALWFWGEGRQPELGPTDWSAIWTSNDLIKGLAYLADIPCQPVPKNAEMILDNSYPEQAHLVVFPKHMPLSDIEHAWAKPLWDGLKNKNIQQLKILLNTTLYELDRKKLKRWWRRGKING